MNYLELVIRTSEAGLEAVSAALMGLGISEFLIDDPGVDREMADHVLPSEYVDREELLAEPDREPSVTVWFESDPAGVRMASEVHRAIRALREAADRGAYGDAFDPGSLEITTELRRDDEWKDNWQQYYAPVRIGDRIVVRPSWEAYDAADPEDIVIAVDPGMAFGTGTHETTRIAARLMEKYLRKDDRVLDVGCGSGILSIIAVKLGASEAFGIDIDPEAVWASQENFILNEVETAAEARYGDLTAGVDRTADLVTANLLTGLIEQLTPAVPAHLVPGGIYISSGILSEHEDRIRAVLEANGFEILEVLTEGSWCGFAAERR